MTLAELFSYLATGSLPASAIFVWAWRSRIKAAASKTGADAAKVLVDTALGAAASSIAAVERRAEAVTRELDDALLKIRALLEHVEECHDRMRAARITPPDFRYPPLRKVGS